MMEPKDRTSTEQKEPSNYLRTAIPASLQVPFMTEEVQQQEQPGQQRTAELPDETVFDQQSNDEESLPDIFTAPVHQRENFQFQKKTFKLQREHQKDQHEMWCHQGPEVVE